MRKLRSRSPRRLLGIGGVAAAALATVGCQPRMPAVHPLDEAALVAHLEARVPELMRRYSVPGVSMVVISQGQAIWTGAFGHADVERQRPLTTDMPVMAHSISKAVTAWGVMKLVHEGRIGLDDAVGDHIRSWRLPESGYADQEVTVRRLLSHSASLPLGMIGVHYAPGDAIPPLADLLAGPDVALVREPGTAFSYSNSGYGILALLIQEVTGREFAEYMETEVLRPLGMVGSTFAWRDELSAVPTGYDLRGQPVPVYLVPNRASGGLFTTLDDLGRFASIAAGGVGSPVGRAVLDAGSMAELYMAQIPISGLFRFVSPAYGLGHFVEPLPDGSTAVWHGGQGLGWMTHFHATPERGHAIVIVTNSQRSWPLMAHVLNDWARWAGVGAVGMGRIARAETAMWVVIGGVFLLALWLATRVWRHLERGRRRFAPALLLRRPIQLAQGATGGALLGGLLWAAAQEYLYISSVLPRSAVWLGAALATLALVLVGSGLLPPRRADEG